MGLLSWNLWIARMKPPHFLFEFTRPFFHPNQSAEGCWIKLLSFATFFIYVKPTGSTEFGSQVSLSSPFSTLRSLQFCIVLSFSSTPFLCCPVKATFPSYSTRWMLLWWIHLCKKNLFFPPLTFGKISWRDMEHCLEQSNNKRFVLWMGLRSSSLNFQIFLPEILMYVPPKYTLRTAEMETKSLVQVQSFPSFSRNPFFFIPSVRRYSKYVFFSFFFPAQNQLSDLLEQQQTNSQVNENKKKEGGETNLLLLFLSLDGIKPGSRCVQDFPFFYFSYLSHFRLLLSSRFILYSIFDVMSFAGKEVAKSQTPREKKKC